jgi:hypothetical protein
MAGTAGHRPPGKMGEDALKKEGPEPPEYKENSL